MNAIFCIICGSDRMSRDSRLVVTATELPGYSVMSIVPVLTCEACGDTVQLDGTPLEGYDPR